MKAWLVTWDWMADAAAVADRVAAILRPRMTPRQVAETVELLYARATSTLAEVAAYAKHPKTNPYRAKALEINGLVQGDHFVCGHHPWLYARKVSDLVVAKDPTTGLESINWKEPDTYRLKDDESGIEVAAEGRRDSFMRQVSGPVLDDLIWDGGTKTWKDGFSDPDA